jgi:hypothetical protein
MTCDNTNTGYMQFWYMMGGQALVTIGMFKCRRIISVTNIPCRAYVQDPFSQSKWYLFDDTKVEEVMEQTVWSQSRGGQDGTTSSAYCLMYLHHSSSATSPVNGAINFHTITGFHPAIASLHPISTFYSAPSPKNNTHEAINNTFNDANNFQRSGSSPTHKSPTYLTKNNKIGDSLPNITQTSPSPVSTPYSHYYPQTLLSTSPPLFSARNLLIDSPVLIPVSVKSLVDTDNRAFEDEVLQWHLRVIQGMGRAEKRKKREG